MKQFKLFWTKGTTSIVYGHSVADAMDRAGYSKHAVFFLDRTEYVSEVEYDSYEFEKAMERRS